MWLLIGGASLLTEMGLLAGAGVAGWRLADGWARVALAVLLPVVVATLWGLWIAPRATRRVSDPGRLVLEAVLFTAVGGLLVVTGLPWWGALLAVGGTVVAAVARRFTLPA